MFQRAREFSTLTFIPFLLLLLLSSCGGGGGSSSGQATSSQTSQTSSTVGTTGSESFYPVAIGDVWNYQTPDGIENISVTGTTVVNGQSAFVLTSRIGELRAKTNNLRKTETGYSDLSLFQNIGTSEPIGPIEFLRLPLVAGQVAAEFFKLIYSAYDEDGDGLPEPGQISITARAIGMEKIEVGNTVYNAMKVERTVKTVAAYSSIPDVEENVITSIEWYSQGIGQIKQVVYSDSKQVISTKELIGYRVGDRSNVASASVLTPKFIDLDGKAKTQGKLEYFSSFALIPALRQEDYPTVYTPTGIVLQGNWTVSSNSLTFVQTSGTLLAQGTEIKLLINKPLKDINGNTATFSDTPTFIDREGPKVVSSIPAEGSIGINVNTTGVTIQFDEPIDQQAVDPAYFKLVHVSVSNTETTVPISATQVGISGVLVKPLNSLTSEGSYRIIVLPGFKDRLGNGSSLYNGQSINLYGTQGSFTFPIALPRNTGADPSATYKGKAVVAADINSDSKLDLISVGYLQLANGSIGNVAFEVYPQLSSGVFGQRVSIPISWQQCLPTSVSVNDYNNDGRKDVLVVGAYCGYEIFYQTSLGLFSGAGRQSLPYYIANITSGDLNNDGRLDLLAAGVEGVYIWYQQANGQFAAATASGQSAQTPDDLGPARFVTKQIVDIDGDGIPEIFGSTYTSISDQFAYVSRQLNGSYSGVTLTGVNTTYSSPEIKDIDGDGSLDLLSIDNNDLLTRYSRSSTGQFLAIGTLQLRHALRDRIVAMDFNQDGRIDIAVQYSIPSYPDYPSFGLYLLDATTTYLPEKRFKINDLTPFSPWAIGDFNGDGYPDIAAPTPAIVFNLFGRSAMASFSVAEKSFSSGIKSGADSLFGKR